MRRKALSDLRVWNSRHSSRLSLCFPREHRRSSFVPSIVYSFLRFFVSSFIRLHHRVQCLLHGSPFRFSRSSLVSPRFRDIGISLRVPTEQPPTAYNRPTDNDTWQNHIFFATFALRLHFIISFILYSLDKKDKRHIRRLSRRVRFLSFFLFSPSPWITVQN